MARVQLSKPPSKEPEPVPVPVPEEPMDETEHLSDEDEEDQEDEDNGNESDKENTPYNETREYWEKLFEAKCVGLSFKLADIPADIIEPALFGSIKRTKDKRYGIARKIKNASDDAKKQKKLKRFLKQKDELARKIEILRNQS